MKRLIALVLAAVMLCSAEVLPAARAASGDDATIQQVVNALGIVSGDENGNLNLTGNVTRAEFSKMLVSASTLKDSVSATGNSAPFRDVPYTHWAANYIKTAVSQGWMTGYLDGTYRPENPVTLAEAANAALKLLGYASTDFSGSFPEAQMAMMQSSGLGDGITGAAATTLSRSHAVRLFYNLLSIKTKDGSQKYMQVLGYSLDADGNPDYNSLLQATMDGPVVYTSGNLAQTLGFTPTTVYRNGAASSAALLQPYDVLYYAASRSTVWAYSRRVTGIYESAAPSKDNPTTVTVAGVSYPVSSATALYQLGSEGSLAIGASVTLLLGKNGDVAAAYAAEEMATDLVGLVTAKGTGAYQTASGAAYTAINYTVLGVDGQSYTVQAEKNNSSVGVGSLVHVTFPSSGASIRALTRSSVSGKVTANTIGSKKVSPNVKILDVADTRGVTVHMARLNGLTLSGSDMSYYELNAEGEIEAMILNNVTGDAYTYGVVLTADENATSAGASGSYTFFIDGQKTSLNTSGSLLHVSPGPARFILKNGAVSAAKTLTEIKNITSIQDMYIKNGDASHTIWDYVSVYFSEGGVYTQLDRSELDPEKHYIRAFYDQEDAEGGRVRVILATPRSE